TSDVTPSPDVTDSKNIALVPVSAITAQRGGRWSKNVTPSLTVCFAGGSWPLLYAATPAILRHEVAQTRHISAQASICSSPSAICSQSSAQRSQISAQAPQVT